jgi:hypothetical protein
VELVSDVSNVVFASPLGPVPQESMLCGLIVAAVAFVGCCVVSAAAASAVYASSEIPMSDGGIVTPSGALAVLANAAMFCCSSVVVAANICCSFWLSVMSLFDCIAALT